MTLTLSYKFDVAFYTLNFSLILSAETQVERNCKSGLEAFIFRGKTYVIINVCFVNLSFLFFILLKKIY